MGIRGAVILNFLKGSRHSHDFGYEFSLRPHGCNIEKCAPLRRRDRDDEFLRMTIGDWEPVALFECCLSPSGHIMQVCL